MSRRLHFSFLGAGLMSMAWAASSWGAPQYQILNLGSFGGSFSSGNDINELGEVTGQSQHANGRIEAFRTQPNSPINPATDGLGNMGGSPPDSYGDGINDLGQVVGSGWTSGGFHAGFTGANGHYSPASDMGTLGGFNSYAFAVNNRGEIIGTASVVQDNPAHGFRTNGSRPINPATDDLGTLGGPSSDAEDINELGQVVGSSALPGGTVRHVFRTAPDAPINAATDDIGGLGGMYAVGRAINDLGQVSGYGTLPGESQHHAFRTAPGAVITPATDDLGTLGGANSDAGDINNSGVVVGSSDPTAGDFPHAFVALPGEPMADLNTLLVNPIPGAILTYAFGINDHGQIVGEMYMGGPEQVRGFVLTPVPEPAAILPGALLATLLVARACGAGHQRAACGDSKSPSPRLLQRHR